FARTKEVGVDSRPGLAPAGSGRRGRRGCNQDSGAPMGFHSFSLDPRTILGVGPDASLEEIHEAYRVKSKKHHPDLGGDEWAFRMVARAYEVLKTTAAEPAARPWERRGAEGAGPGRSDEGTWTWSRPFARPGGTPASPGDVGVAAAKRNGAEPPVEPDQA